jgi:hypothetical protein
MKFAHSAVLLALTCGSIAAPTSGRGQQKSPSLAWGPCDMEGFNASIATLPIQCAKLTVPLDYTDPKSRDLQLQLLKVNATKESYGSVLFNPGGPQATGTDDVATNAKIYSELLGGHYDLIGFDPRYVFELNTVLSFPLIRPQWYWSNDSIQLQPQLDRTLGRQGTPTPERCRANRSPGLLPGTRLG